MHPDHLHPLVSRALARAWRSRAQGEARVGRAFSAIAAALRAHDEVTVTVLDALDAGAREEAAHTRLCDELALRYDADVPAATPFVDDPLPLATPEERGVVLVSACCISESIASAYLEHCYATATAPLAKTALHTLLRDEIGHAQLGWAFVASLPAASPVRLAISASIDGLVERTRLAWHERIATLHATAAPDHGYPPAAACQAVVDEAARDLVHRGFAHVGLR